MLCSLKADYQGFLEQLGKTGAGLDPSELRGDLANLQGMYSCIVDYISTYLDQTLFVTSGRGGTTSMRSGANFRVTIQLVSLPLSMALIMQQQQQTYMPPLLQRRMRKNL